MIINLKRVAKIIEEKKANPPSKVKEKDKLSDGEYYRRHVLSELPRPKPGQLNPIWYEFNKVKESRAKLSNRIFDEVQRGATKDELMNLIDSIKAFQSPLENLFDQARHVDQYGTLPKVDQKQEEPTPDTWLLKDKKRKLIDKRSKLLKKINAGSKWEVKANEETGELSLDEKKKVVAKNDKKLTEWQAELDQVNAEYLFVDEELKRIEGKV